MRFEPRYFADKLTIINPEGWVGIVTLWSPVDRIITRLADAGVWLSGTGPVAVVGNLYGEGFKHLLRNLCWNPQISTVVVMGSDRSGSGDYLTRFLGGQLEPAPSVTYVGVPNPEQFKAVRLKGTRYVMDDGVIPEMLSYLRVVRLDGLDSRAQAGGAAAAVREAPHRGEWLDRRHVELPCVEVDTYPSDVRGHTVVADSITEAWRQLTAKLVRFGRNIRLPKGERRELQNVKVVINRPRWEDPEVLQANNLTKAELEGYQRFILNPDLGEHTYTYGNRLLSYFTSDKGCPRNLLLGMVERLDEANRGAYLTLWDNTRDLFIKHGKPCFVSLFARKTEALHLTACFRTHNAGRAWPQNAYGIMALQEWLCVRSGEEPGTITIISHSISLDPRAMEQVRAVYDEVVSSERVWREDPNGYFQVTTDGGEIVLRHMHEGVQLDELRSDSPLALQRRLARRWALSDINHALYLGRQIERAAQCLREGTTYVQED